MKLSEFKSKLAELKSLNFILPDGSKVPEHFHITEVGLITKKFIDCGGVVHIDEKINLQIWVADDYEHRLKPKTLIGILDMSNKILEEKDLEVEIEYEIGTINKFSVEFIDSSFMLKTKHTDCLAKVKCNIPVLKQDCCSGNNCC